MISSWTVVSSSIHEQECWWDYDVELTQMYPFSSDGLQPMQCPY